MQGKIEDHEVRIGKLEQNQEEFNKNIQELKEHQQNTSDTLSKINSNVLNSSNDQKELLGKLITYHFDMKTNELNNNTEVKKQEITGKTEVSKLKWQAIVGLLSAGGLISFIAQWIIGSPGN